MAVQRVTGVKHSVMRGAGWTLAANGGDRLLGIVSVSILARLLTPQDFGLVSMGFAAAAAVDCLGAFGFDWALVRQPNLTALHLNTAWTLRIIVNVISALALALLAAPAAAYFHEERLYEVMFVLAACKLLAGFENIGMVLYRRELRFDKEFQLLLLARLANLAVVLPIAYFQRSYFALLAGLVTSRVVSLVTSYGLHPYRPRLSLAAHRDLLLFSVWLQLNGLLLTIRDRVSDLIVGRTVGVHGVALFSMANEVAHLAVTELAAPINRAVFSGYAKFAGDADRMRHAYLRVAGVIWLLCLPIAVGIACTAPQIVLLFLGPNWSEAAPVLRILAIGGLAGVVTANSHLVFLTMGRPVINTLISLVCVLLLVPCVVVLSKLDGVRGAALGYAIAVGATVPIVFWRLWRETGLSPLRVLASGWRPALGVIVMVAVVLTVGGAEASNTFLANALELAKLAGIGGATFVSTVYLAWKFSGKPAGPETEIYELAESILGIARGTGPPRTEPTESITDR
ncbi:MAG TPA: oligosaccharide flippase family protein [Pseudomonadales bacterium]